MRKPQISKRELLGGLVAGSATVFGSTVILLLLGLIPSQPVRDFFGTWFEHPVSRWIAYAFLSPFWGLVTTRSVYPEFELTQRWHVVGGASFGALLVFVAVLCLVGIGVRRRVEGSRRRASTLVATALTVAVIVTIAAAVVSWAHTFTYTTQGELSGYSLEVHNTYGPLAYSFGAVALTLLVGVFCFGLVGMLRQPWRTALRRAAAFVGMCFVVFGLLFPVFVVSDNLRGAKIFDDFGNASTFSAAIGGLAIPLALQTPVSLTQNWSSPFLSSGAANTNGDTPLTHWGWLAMSMTLDHPHGRLVQYATSLGVVGSIVGAAISVAMVCALVLVSIGLCRKVGARGMRRGFEIGILQGGCIGCLLAVVLWLTSQYLGQHYSDDGGMSDYWGVTAFGAVQTAVMLIAVCGLSGLVYGRRQARRDGDFSDERGIQAPE